MSSDADKPEDPKTVFVPLGEGSTGYSSPPATTFVPRQSHVAIQVGDVLNHIFEVRRFIARGGMGEVFEGVNVTSDERVAIKVMLPALAADPNVISMFRKEARTLIGLRHDALVQYRVLAQEPQLGVLYIVTEYIDGVNLSQELGTIRADLPDLIALLHRLASGLETAHKLGAIHRDIAPDNVVLENSRLAGAKIIDFGIAKEMDPGSATIVGDGFAGKLNYVAPEQLGDYGRVIGPWTDVYSLALVLLAIAQGRDVSMGGTLVDAVDSRRSVPDLSAVPEPLRPLLEQMLQPNPVDRIRTMTQVLSELALVEARLRPSDVAATGGKNDALRGVGWPAWLKWGFAVVVLAIIVLSVILWKAEQPTPASPVAGPAVKTESKADPISLARGAVDTVLPSVGCTWLQIVDITPGDRGPTVRLTGVAGNPAAAQNEISQALAQRNVEGADIDFSEVAQITQSGCAALDTYRQIRLPDSSQLSVPQRKFEMRTQPNDPDQTGYPGENAANVVLQLAPDDPQTDFAVIGLEPSGLIVPEFAGPGSGVLGRDGLQSLAKQTRMITDDGNDRYRMQVDVNHSGWSGVLLLTGKGPFDKDLIAPPVGKRGPDWTGRFLSEAAAKGWQAQMVWFKTVDEQPE